MHLVERFTRVDGDTLRYEFTVDDPDDLDAQAWTASMPMTRSTELMFEYACHEGELRARRRARRARGFRKSSNHPVRSSFSSRLT